MEEMIWEVSKGEAEVLVGRKRNPNLCGFEGARETLTTQYFR